MSDLNAESGTSASNEAQSAALQAETVLYWYKETRKAARRVEYRRKHRMPGDRVKEALLDDDGQEAANSYIEGAKAAREAAFHARRAASGAHDPEPEVAKFREQAARHAHWATGMVLKMARICRKHQFGS